MNFNVSQPMVKKLKIRYSLIFCNPTKRWKQKPKVLPKSCQTQVLLLFLFEASQNCGISMRDHHQQTGATRIRQWLSPTHGVRRNCFEQNIEWLDQRTWTLKIVPIEVSKKKNLWNNQSQELVPIEDSILLLHFSEHVLWLQDLPKLGRVPYKVVPHS